LIVARRRNRISGKQPAEIENIQPVIGIFHIRLAGDRVRLIEASRGTEERTSNARDATLIPAAVSEPVQPEGQVLRNENARIICRERAVVLVDLTHNLYLRFDP
jgi:hypothetical protein